MVGLESKILKNVFQIFDFPLVNFIKSSWNNSTCDSEICHIQHTTRNGDRAIPCDPLNDVNRPRKGGVDNLSP